MWPSKLTGLDAKSFAMRRLPKLDGWLYADDRLELVRLRPPRLPVPVLEVSEPALARDPERAVGLQKCSVGCQEGVDVAVHRTGCTSITPRQEGTVHAVHTDLSTIAPTVIEAANVTAGLRSPNSAPISWGHYVARSPDDPWPSWMALSLRLNPLAAYASPADAG